MAVIDELKAVREWLSEPEHWCKNEYAEPKTCYGYEPEVTATCLVGAVYRIKGTFNIKRDDPTYMAIVNCTPKHSVIILNDAATTTHEDILRVLDCAIDKEIAKETTND